MLQEQNPFLAIRRQIERIKVARFSAEINSLLRVPNNIVTVLDVQNDGHIWFFTYCKKGYLQDTEKTFYAYLDFNERDTGARLQARGVATIVEDEEAKFLQDNKQEQDIVLVRLKVMHVECMELTSASSGWTEKLWKNLYHLVFPSHEKVYDFS